MLYLSGSVPAKAEVLAMFKSLPTGVMGNPRAGYDHGTHGMPWAADNGCFSNRWDPAQWLGWLARHAHAADSCLFAVVPDVVGDHRATLTRWAEWSGRVRALGYRLAFVAQNGCGALDVPWAECDAVFIGGDDRYKLGAEAHAVVAEAKRRGKWAHMGRVNSLRRLRIAADMGCDSADGTFVAFGPDVNVPKIAGWFDAMTTAPSLFGGAA